MVFGQVDEIFGDVFNSTGAKNSKVSQPFATATPKTIKEKRKLCVPPSSLAYGSGPIMLVPVVSSAGELEDENSRVKPKFVPVCPKTIALPSVMDTVSDSDLSTCVSTATTTLPNDLSAKCKANECVFLKFAAAYFQTGTTPYYTSGRILRPLFKHRNQRDFLVCRSDFNQCLIKLVIADYLF